MLQLNYLTNEAAVANQGGAIETNPISNPKNRRNRGNLFKTFIFTLLSVFIIFGSCSEEEDSDIRIREVDWDLLEDTTIEVGEVLTITGKVTPANHTEKKFFLNSSNSNIAAVDGNVNGANVTITVTGVSPGVATISITMTESNISKSIEVTVTGDNSNGVIKLLESITYERSDHYFKFEYDDQNRISKMEQYDGRPAFTYTFVYNGDDPVGIAQSGETEALMFNKNGNKITYTYVDDPDFVITLELNSDGTLKKESSSMDDNSWETSYQYKDGNLTKISGKRTDEDGTETWESELKYDSKNAPFLHCKTSKWFLIWADLWGYIGIKNNPIEESWVDYDGDHGKETFTYVYDSDGYPTKCTTKRTYEDDDDYEYEYVTEFTYITK